MTSSKRLATTVVLAAFTSALTCCSALVKSPVPGIRNKVSAQLPKGLEYWTALTAIKVAIRQAIEATWDFQQTCGDSRISELQFQPGNVILTTTVLTDVTDNGNVTMIIPFSNLAKTQATPGLLNVGREAASKQIRQLSFTLEPKSIYAPGAKRTPDLQGITIHNGLREALLADFKAFKNVPPNTGIPVQPKQIGYTFNLAVTRTGTGNITVSIFPTTPTLTNISPGVSSKRTDTLTNDLAITLPLSYPVPNLGSQPTTLIYQVHGDKGSAWIQTPYTEAELTKVIGNRSDSVPPAHGITNQQLLNLLKAMGANKENKLDEKTFQMLDQQERKSRQPNPPVPRDPKNL